MVHRRRLIIFLLVLVGLLVLVAAWSWGPLKALLDPEKLVANLREAGMRYGWYSAIAGFAVASSVGVPLIFLTIVSIVAFGPILGTVITLTGGAFGAAFSFMLGQQLGSEVLEHYGGKRLNLISERLGQRGILAAAALRMVPIAPFAVINMVAGTSHIRLRDYLLGSALGMTPGTLLFAAFVDSLAVALHQPGPTSTVLVIVTLILIVLGIWLGRKWLARLD